MRTSTLDSPIGPLTLIADGGNVVAAGFTADAQMLRARLPEPLSRQALEQVDSLDDVTDAAAAYLAGDIRALDAIPVRHYGGEFIDATWAALRRIPPGLPVTYSQLAADAGRPAAVRAAAAACARNLIAPIVPCHRVVRRDGSLGGYYWGLPVKAWLLAHEARSTAG